MKNILVPTDFTVKSLELVSMTARAVDDKINVILFHAFDMPDSLMDVMMRTQLGGYGRLITEDIRVKCRKLKAAHSNISNISFRFMYGTTMAAFRNYADANKIDMIMLPEDYSFIPVVRDSVDIVHMFRRSGIEILSDLTPHDWVPGSRSAYSGIRRN